MKFDNADKAKKGRKLKIAGQAFGVGAYEEDDDDIYQRDDMSRYDFALGIVSNVSNKKSLVIQFLMNILSINMIFFLKQFQAL